MPIFVVSQHTNITVFDTQSLNTNSVYLWWFIMTWIILLYKSFNYLLKMKQINVSEVEIERGANMHNNVRLWRSAR